MQNKEAIKEYMSKFGADGHSIIKTEAILKMGFSEDFVAPHSYNHQSGEGHKSTIYDDRGNAMKSCMGVYALDFLYAIAQDIGADTSGAEMKMGRGFQAQELNVAINKKMEE